MAWEKRMYLDEFWRFDLVRGYSTDPSRGACLLTAVSWLVEGKRSDRPKCVCPLLAQFGRRANDILVRRDRQRLKAFIYRLGSSRDSSAVDRRARILVDGIMGGPPEGGPAQLVLYIERALAIGYLRMGLNAAALHVAMAAFRKRYERGVHDHRMRLVDVLCEAFDAALSAGVEGERDPVHAAAAMDRYQRLSGTVQLNV